MIQYHDIAKICVSKQCEIAGDKCGIISIGFDCIVLKFLVEVAMPLLLRRTCWILHLNLILNISYSHLDDSIILNGLLLIKLQKVFFPSQQLVWGHRLITALIARIGFLCKERRYCLTLRFLKLLAWLNCIFIRNNRIFESLRIAFICNTN